MRVTHGIYSLLNNWGSNNVLWKNQAFSNLWNLVVEHYFSKYMYPPNTKDYFMPFPKDGVTLVSQGQWTTLSDVLFNRYSMFRFILKTFTSMIIIQHLKLLPSVHRNGSNSFRLPKKKSRFTFDNKEQY